MVESKQFPGQIMSPGMPMLNAVAGHTMLGMVRNAAVQAAVKLGLPDVIENDGATADEIADAVDADPDTCERLLRALAFLGVFQQKPCGNFAHTDISRALRSDAPGRLTRLAQVGAEEWMWQAWHGLADTVRSGRTFFQTSHGKDMFSYFADDAPEAGVCFRQAIAALSETVVDPVVNALDLSDVRTIADVGGGQGALLCAILERHPYVEGTLVDTEPALAEADGRLRAGALTERTRLVTADITREVPVATDVYLLKHVLHMWDDNTCVRVLRNVVASAPSDARVIVLEQLLAEEPRAATATLMDLQLMVTTGGRERTIDEFTELFDQAGLHFAGVTPTSAMQYVIEARIK